MSVCACMNPRCQEAGRCLGAPGGPKEAEWLAEKNGMFVAVTGFGAAEQIRRQAAEKMREKCAKWHEELAYGHRSAGDKVLEQAHESYAKAIRALEIDP